MTLRGGRCLPLSLSLIVLSRMSIPASAAPAMIAPADMRAEPGSGTLRDIDDDIRAVMRAVMDRVAAQAEANKAAADAAEAQVNADRVAAEAAAAKVDAVNAVADAAIAVTNAEKAATQAATAKVNAGKVAADAAAVKAITDNAAVQAATAKVIADKAAADAATAKVIADTAAVDPKKPDKATADRAAADKKVAETTAVKTITDKAAAETAAAKVNADNSAAQAEAAKVIADNAAVAAATAKGNADKKAADAAAAKTKADKAAADAAALKVKADKAAAQAQADKVEADKAVLDAQNLIKRLIEARKAPGPGGAIAPMEAVGALHMAPSRRSPSPAPVILPPQTGKAGDDVAEPKPQTLPFGVAFSRMPKIEQIPADSVEAKDDEPEDKTMLRFSFVDPAHFPLHGFGARGIVVDNEGTPIELDGAVIHEGMTLFYDTEGYYKVALNVTTVSMPVMLYLQLLVQVGDQAPLTLTLPAIQLRGSDEAEPVSYRVSARGHSLAMKQRMEAVRAMLSRSREGASDGIVPNRQEQAIKVEVTRSKSKARFGSVPSPIAK